MKRQVIFILALFLACGPAGCNGSNGNGDADVDIDVDVDPDADAADAADVEADGEAPPDVAEDPDAETDPDVAEDPDGVDAEEDVESDPDGGEELPSCTTIVRLREMADGVVDVNLCPALVTYVFWGGYFIQVDSEGPAIEVFEGSEWAPDVAVGDEISMHVTSLTTYHGVKEIDGHDPVTVLTTGNDISGLVQDLSSGVTPSEELESEIVRITGAAVADIDGRYLTISYATASGVNLTPIDSGALCLGATFSILAVVSEWEDDSIHFIRSFEGGDFYDVNTSMCTGSGRPPAPGELLLNELLADPPSGMPGDANCDGTRDAYEDEFVEIVNVSTDELSLEGVTISDDTYVRHTFSPGMSLAAGKAVVVFGGGDPSCTIWPSDVWVFKSSTGTMALNNDGDTISVSDASEALIVTCTYGAEASWNESLTLNPDLDDEDATPTGISGYEQHGTADTDDGSPFSPGTHIDQSPF